MAKELEHFNLAGLTVYARPLPLTDSLAAAVDMAEDADNPGYYWATVAMPAFPYVVCVQSGGAKSLADAKAEVLGSPADLRSVNRSPASLGTQSTTPKNVDIEIKEVRGS